MKARAREVSSIFAFLNVCSRASLSSLFREQFPRGREKDGIASVRLRREAINKTYRMLRGETNELSAARTSLNTRRGTCPREPAPLLPRKREAPSTRAADRSSDHGGTSSRINETDCRGRFRWKNIVATTNDTRRAVMLLDYLDKQSPR